MTQSQLSELIDCENSTLAHIETGKNLPSMTKIQKIATALNINVYQLFLTEDLSDNNKIIESINELLRTANKTELKLIYNIIRDILNISKQKTK